MAKPKVTERHTALARAVLPAAAQLIADAEERVDLSAVKLLANAEMLRDRYREERDEARKLARSIWDGDSPQGEKWEDIPDWLWAL